MTTRHARFGPRGGDAVGPVGARRRLTPADWAALLWRELPVMLVAWALITAAGLMVLTGLNPDHEARARLLVQPMALALQTGGARDAAAVMPQSPDDQVRAEIEILTSRVVADRAMRRIGAGGPDLASFRSALSAQAAPGAGVIRVAFRHDDPRFAARALTILLDAYLGYRLEVMRDDRALARAAQAADIEEQLRRTETEIAAFLAGNGVTDVDGERATLLAVREAETQALASAEASLGAARARAARLEATLAQTPRDITLFTETDARRQIRELELEREALLSRFTPESQTVRAADERLARARALLEQPDANQATLRRTGPNANWYDLNLDRARAVAEAEAMAARITAIRATLAENERALTRLQGLRATHEALTRRRAILDAAARQIAAQAQAERSAADSIRILDRARPQPRALGLPALWLWALGGLGTLLALCAGTWRASRRPGFPTAACAARTVGLPVLAAVR